MFWLLLAAFGHFWVLLAAFGYFWLLLAAFGWFWVVLVAFYYGFYSHKFQKHFKRKFMLKKQLDAAVGDFQFEL